MKNLPSFLHNKKLIFAVIIIIIIVVILNIKLYLQSTKESVSEETITIGIITPTKSILVDTTPTPEAQPTFDPQQYEWITGDNKFYTINYISSWKPLVNNVLNGGSGVTLKPAVLPDGNLLPSMHIEVSPTGPARSISKRLELLTPLGLTRTDITFHGIQAVRLSGTMPFKPLPENPNKNLIHKDYTFFEKANNIYIITFAYYLDPEAPKNVQIYNSMLDSFKIK